MADRFEELKTYIAVVEAGGFAAASKRLALAKSAISRRIRDLEIRLGAPLLNRSTRQIHLTDTGLKFYEQAKRILTELNEAENAVGGRHNDLQGRLRIAAPVSLTVHCLSRVVGQFIEANPNLALEFDADDKMVDIIRDGFDLAIRISKLRDSSLVARRITTIRHVCCASPSLLDRYGRPNRVEDLAALPGIRYSNVEESYYWRFAGGHTPMVKSRLCFPTVMLFVRPPSRVWGSLCCPLSSRMRRSEKVSSKLYYVSICVLPLVCMRFFLHHKTCLRKCAHSLIFTC